MTRDSYIGECKQIAQNALYTAQTHHETANLFRWMNIWLQAVPAVAAAVTGALVGSGASPKGLLWVTVFASAITAITSVVNPYKEYEDHSRAAKNFTGIRHDARFLHEARVHQLSDDEFKRDVEQLHCRYNDLAEVSPTTTRKMFEKARSVVQLGRHDPDRNVDGSVR